MEINKIMKNKSEKYVIYSLLILIILCTIFLIYRENQTPDYDEKQYARVYEEYNEILESIQIVDSQNNTNIITSNEIIGNKYTITNQNEIRRVAAVLEIEKIDIFYPVVQEMTDENLKIAPTKLYGPEANEIGNFCIVAHNYHNEAHFSRLKELENGDIVNLTGRNGEKIKYSVYDKYEINPKDLACLSQETNEKKEVTLITCTNDSKRRLVVKCTEI